jgi:hypothetical protein
MTAPRSAAPAPVWCPCGNVVPPERQRLRARWCSNACRKRNQQPAPNPVRVSKGAGRPWRRTVALLRKQPPYCGRCGGWIDVTLPANHPGSWTAGHVLDAALGGTDDLSNLRPEHRACNLQAGARLGAAMQPRRPSTRPKPHRSVWGSLRW